jgi:hypothetical protein
VIVAFLLVTNVGFATPRLAIVSENSETTQAADILTAQLSRRSDLVLLERDQVQKIFQEQSLAASHGEFAQIGQILGADGLLLLTLHAEQEPPLLEARLLAVHPGVIVLEHDYPWPLANQQEWSALVASEFSKVLPKLEVLTKDAVPISILGLRSALKSPQAESLERELNTLLYNRLMKEKELFVLERRRMELLTTEKQFAISTNSEFWNGSCLLEGIVNKEGTSSNKVTITAQLKPPGGASPISLETAGTRDHLPDLISALVSWILGSLQKKATSPAWDTAAESTQYLNEAQWMFKWAMFPEAKAACENAWALGLQTSEVAQIRVKSYLASAGNPGYGAIDRDPPRVTFVRFNTPHLGNTRIATTFAAPSQSENLTDLLRAAELFSDGYHHFTSHTGADTNWIRLGTNVITQSSEWLRYFYFTVEERSGHEDDLAELRRLTREFSDWLDGLPLNLAIETTNWAWIKGTRGAFWFESPEQGANFYRQIIKTGQWAPVRTRFINHYSYQVARNASRTYWGPQLEADLSRPCLAGWKWETRKHWMQAWNKFVDELCASADPSVKLEGLYLRCSWSWASSDFADRFEELVRHVSQNREKILDAHLDELLIRDIIILLRSRQDELGQAVAERLKHGPWSTLPDELVKLRETRNRAIWFESYAEYFRTANDYDFHTFAKMSSPPSPFKPQETEQLLPLLEGFKARLNAPTNALSLALTNTLEKTSNENARKAAISKFNVDARSRNLFIDSVIKRLQATISPSPPALAITPATTQSNPIVQRPAPLAGIPMQPGISNAPNSIISGIPRGPFFPGSAQSAKQPPITTAFGSASLSNILEVSKFWKLPEPPANTNRLFPRASLEILHAILRENKIMLQAGTSQFLGRQVHYFAVAPDTFTFKHAIYQDDTGEFIIMAGLSHSMRFFELYHNKLYVGLKDSVRSYDFERQQWERIELPSSSASIPVRLQDRLFFLTETSILERETNGDFRVLASARRRPAQTILDNLDNFGEYGPLSLFMNRAGNLFAAMKNDLYCLKRETNDWSRVCSMPSNVSGPVSAYDDGILIRSGGIGMQANTDLYGYYGRFETMQLLFRKTPDDGFGFVRQARDTLTPRWQLPAGIDLVNAATCIAGDDLWMLAGPDFRTDSQGQPQIVETNGWNALLLHFASDDQNSGVIPLRLNIAPTLSSKVSATPQNYIPRRNSVLQMTPKGMIIANGQVAGFWLIPPPELSARQVPLLTLKSFRP